MLLRDLVKMVRTLGRGAGGVGELARQEAIEGRSMCIEIRNKQNTKRIIWIIYGV